MRIDFLEAVEQIHMNYGVICGGEIAIIMKEGCLFSEPVSGSRTEAALFLKTLAYPPSARHTSNGRVNSTLSHVGILSLHYCHQQSMAQRAHLFKAKHMQWRGKANKNGLSSQLDIPCKAFKDEHVIR